jgi:alkanesulfonate monooxygenase SsuD/methylene tetrahydromethanopterin reductase-like flavin-dependent oxidoreductase (luciferase family)
MGLTTDRLSLPGARLKSGLDGGADRGRRLEATIVAVQALLAGERVTSEELGLRATAVAPRPPRPLEWWIGAITEPAIDRAARLGTGWYTDPGLTPKTAEPRIRTYLDACDRHGVEPGTRALRKDVFIRTMAVPQPEAVRSIELAGEVAGMLG